MGAPTASAKPPASAVVMIMRIQRFLLFMLPSGAVTAELSTSTYVFFDSITVPFGT
jgi:hypothetical protein